MAQIPNKLLYFSQGSSYRTRREDEEIRDDSIVFIEDDASIVARQNIFGVRGVYPGTCTTAAGTAAKIATTSPLFPLDSSGKPMSGTTIAIKYSNTNSYETAGTTMTLNVNSTGAYPIYYNNAEVVSTTSANTIACGYENRYTYYVFNGTQWVWLGAGMEYDDSALSNRVSTLERAGYITKQATYVRLNVDHNDVLTFQDMNGNSISIATFQTLLFDDSKEVILVDDYLGSKYDVDSYFRLSSIEYRHGDDYEARFNCESFDGHMYSTCLQYKEDGGFFVSSRCLEYSPPIASTSSPLIDGTATAGNSIRYAREDHVHPSDTSRVPITRTINNKALSSDITLKPSDIGNIIYGKKSSSGFREGHYYSNGGWTYLATPKTLEVGVLYIDVESRHAYYYDGTRNTQTGLNEIYYPDISNFVEWTELGDVAFSGSYNDLLDKPTIPSKTSDLTNDSEFISKPFYYGTCPTASTTFTKVCTVETFPTTTSNNVTHARNGTVIAVKFTYSNNVGGDIPKLNVNGIGEKKIMIDNYLINNGAPTLAAGIANGIVYYRYDSSLDNGSGAWEFLGSSIDNDTNTNAKFGQGYVTQINDSAASEIRTTSLQDFKLTSGGILSVKFTYDVPANATLTTGGTAKAIYNKGAAITEGIIKAGDVATFIYSGSIYILLSIDSWQDKQDALVSGSNIRTVNDQSLVGSGNIYTVIFGKKVNSDFRGGTYNPLTNKWAFSVSSVTPTTRTLYFDVSSKKCYVYDGYNYEEFYAPDAQVQADWEETDDTSMAYIWNKPALVGTVTGISVNGGSTQQPINGTVNLTVATGGNTDIVDISDGTANDGSIIFTQRNGDTITLNLNHNHSQYVTASDLGSIPRIDASSTANETTVTIEGTTHTLATASQSITIDAGKYYDFGTRTTLTIFPKEQTTDSTKVYSYMGRFTIDSSLSGTFSFSMLALRKNNSDTTIEGSNAFSFKLPEEVEFEAGNTYEFNILYDICVIKDITVSA